LESLGRYQIVGELGRGGCGVVYRAVDPSIGRTVAIKTIQTDAASSEGAALRSRFRREARSAGSLSHPNIVTIHEFDDSGDPMFIAMEFIDGQTLAKAMCGGRLPSKFILKVLQSAADALDYAHSHNIVHRDVKPANFLIDKSGHLKIADFGVAKLLEIDAGQTSLTCTGMVVGTPQYMSPEQISEDRVSGRSDQFSLAAIAYEMLTGVKPFQGNSWATVIHAIMMTEPPPVTKYCEEWGESVNAVLRKALSKSPADRFATCGEFYQALEPELLAVKAANRGPATGPSAYRPPATGPHQLGLSTGEFAKPPALSPAEPPAKPVKRSPNLKLVAIGAWLVLVVLGVSLGLKWKRTHAPAPVAVQLPAVATPNSAAPPASQSAPLPEPVAASASPAPEPGAKTDAQETRRESAKAESAKAAAPPPSPVVKSPVVKSQSPVSTPPAKVQSTPPPSQTVAVAPSPPSVSAPQAVPLPPTPKNAGEDPSKRMAAEPVKAVPDEQGKRLAEEQNKLAVEEQSKRLADAQAKAAADETAINLHKAELQAISRALMDYQAAYQRKDPAALQTIWPSIPKPILDGIRDSFHDASEVNIDLRSLGEPEISGATATVTCDRNLRQVIRKKVLQASNRVRIVLSRRGSGWVIQSIETVTQ
jgi:serine/threonine protein kinase